MLKKRSSMTDEPAVFEWKIRETNNGNEDIYRRTGAARLS